MGIEIKIYGELFMIDGNLALQSVPEAKPTVINTLELPDIEWSADQYSAILRALTQHGCQFLKKRTEYALLKEVVLPDVTQVSNSGKTATPTNPVNTVPEGSGVNSPLCGAIGVNDTDTASSGKAFMAPLNVQKSGSIADVIPSFRVIQSNSMSLNIGFDTEFQDFHDGSQKNRRVLSLQMTIALGEMLIRYFFLIEPLYQEVTADGGLIPLKYCLADILADLKRCYFNDFPLVLKRAILYKEKQWKNHAPYKVIDYAAMRDSVIPITIICHTGKADISVFRRSKYDIEILRKLGEIQGG
ncbi:MAG: hypothetical protein K5682_01835, partial [Lachnospiraceae bacterium]|nr:hypothetical protein [Lachnospiraceae bacterium]